jgi:hypothetical protein
MKVESSHLTKEEFYQVITKRLLNYRTAIMGNSGSSGMAIGMAQTAHSYESMLRRLDSEYDLFSGDLWGYGINDVSDGNEVFKSPDFSEVAKINELNKHHKEYRLLWLLTFKIKDSVLFVNVFCIDPCNYPGNNNLLVKHDLSDFNQAKPRYRGSKLYVEFEFNSLSKPIHFQIDPIHLPTRIKGDKLANYYITKITELSKVQIESEEATTQMSTTFPQAEKYLNDFFEANKDLYQDAANDFHPTKHHSYAYKIKEEHRSEIYQSVYDMRYHFGNKKDILDLSVPGNFSSPQVAIGAIENYKEYLKGDINEMNKLKDKYSDLSVHSNPIFDVIKYSEEVIECVDYVLELPEIKKYTLPVAAETINEKRRVYLWFANLDPFWKFAVPIVVAIVGIVVPVVMGLNDGNDIIQKSVVNQRSEFIAVNDSVNIGSRELKDSLTAIRPLGKQPELDSLEEKKELVIDDAVAQIDTIYSFYPTYFLKDSILLTLENDLRSIDSPINIKIVATKNGNTKRLKGNRIGDVLIFENYLITLLSVHSKRFSNSLVIKIEHRKSLSHN